MKSPSPASAPTLFGTYQLIDRLGRGGMAEVWKAYRSGPAGFRRALVVKRILPHLVEDPHFVEMFMAEARLSARLNHVNIVQVYELGDVDGEYYLAMEYVRGRDLVKVLRTFREAPDPGLGAYVVREVCRALAYAHTLCEDDGTPLRIIHRDVSPSNMMLCFDGAVKLLDFGIAKALSQSSDGLTQTGTLKGKFSYMSPEHVDGKEVDHRSDLFSAGIVLYEALTARRLFKGASDVQTIARVRDANIPSLRELNPLITPELEQICLRALHRDPAQRYQNCMEMAQALDQIVLHYKWGPERLHALMQERFADEPSQNIPPPEPLEYVKEARRKTVEALRHVMFHRFFWLIFIAVVALAGGVWWLEMRNPVEFPEETTRTEKSRPPLTLPTEVRIRVQSTPEGAEVFLDGEAQSRGRTPLLLVLPRSSNERTLTLKATGYRTDSIQVVTDSDSAVQLTMSQGKESPSLRRPNIERKPGRRSRPSSPNLRRGDVVDPFES